ncbi:hypothetical protein ADL22_02400 [Streptomyces sp. NRRL F-4489]|nr:hypothetical protein ADL22_02400 [Streptomyces sp. NRRL F-4489]
MDSLRGMGRGMPVGLVVRLPAGWPGTGRGVPVGSGAGWPGEGDGVGPAEEGVPDFRQGRMGGTALTLGG